MVRYRGVWVDEAFEGSEELLKIKWGSDAYFKLVRERPELKDVLALGERVVVVTARGKALVFDAEKGAEALSDKALADLFQAAEAKDEKREEKPKG